jgi:hypothetical protein
MTKVVLICASLVAVSTLAQAGTVTFQGTVRLMLANGEVVAKDGMLTTDSNGVRQFSSDELQFVSSTIRELVLPAAAELRR